MKRAASLGAISAVESSFVRAVIGEIDRASALDFKVVPDSSSADIVISAAKRMPRYSAYYDWRDDVFHLAWRNKSRELAAFDQVKIASAILAASGLKDSVDVSLTTFDTVVSWNGSDYYGLAEIDRLALSAMLGASV